MKLLCPVCHAPIKYAYETRHCEVCAWQTKTKQYLHLQLSDTDPLWIDPAALPHSLRSGYLHIREIFTKNSSFLTCALSLRQYLQQLITLPVLIGGSVLYEGNPDFSLPLSLSPDLSTWCEAMEILLARPELHRNPLAKYLLFETQRFGKTAKETAFLPKGLLSLSFKPSKQSLLAMLEETCRLLSALGSVHRQLNLRSDPSSPGQYLFTMEERDYPLLGMMKKRNTCFILTHLLDMETAVFTAVSGPEYEVMPRPEFLAVEKAADNPLPSFASVPGSTALMRRIHRMLDGKAKKGLLLLQTETEMGIPEEEASEKGEQSPLTIVYDARSLTVNPAAGLLETVAAHCSADAELLHSLEGVSPVSLLRLLAFLQERESRKVILVVANADTYDDPLLPLHRLLPASNQLPKGVWIVLHSTDKNFSFKADQKITLSPGDGDQSAFLLDYLQRNDPPRAELPAKRTERLASYVAAARGSLPHVYLLTTLKRFEQRPSARELDALNQPEEIFLQMIGALYGEYEEALVHTLTLCDIAVAGHTLTDLQRLLPMMNPWFLQIVSFDLPLLSRWHILPLQKKYPLAPAALCGLYLKASCRNASLRQLANTLYITAQWGTEAQKNELRSSPWRDIVHNAVLDLSPDSTDTQVLRPLFEALLEIEGITPDTCPAARALLTLYEQQSDFAAWTLSRRLLDSDQSDPLTKQAATLTCAELLAKRGDDRQALEMLLRLPEPEETEVLSPEQTLLRFRTHVLSGEIYGRQDNSAEAITKLEQAFILLSEETLFEPRLTARVSGAHNLCADLYYRQEQYEKALPHYALAANLLARQSAEQPSPDSTRQWIHSLMQTAACHLALEQDTEAIESYQRAEELLQKEDSSDYLSLLATLYSAKAELFERNADTEHALQERSRSIDCLAKLQDTEHRIDLCIMLQTAAQDALNLGKITLAVRYLKTAAVLLEKLIAAGAVHDTEWMHEIRQQLNEVQGASELLHPPADPEDSTVLEDEEEKEKLPETSPELPVEDLRQQIRLAGIALQAKQFFAVIDTLLPLLKTLDRLPKADGLEALQSISLAYIGAQRTEEGIKWMERLMEWTADSDERSAHSDTLAYILSSMGMVYRMRRREDKALESYSAAIAMWQTLLDREEPVDSNRFASAYVNRSVLLSDRKQYARAIEDLHCAIQLRENAETIDQAGLARLYLNLGYVYGQSGEMESALRYNHKAIELREALFAQGLVSAAELARGYLNIGILYGGDKQVEKEVEHYDVAITHLIAVEHLSQEEKQLLIKLYRYRAMSYQSLGRTQEQQEDLRRADLLEG